MNTPKVLIIEDESSIREVYTDILKEGGYIVYESGDGMDGLKKALEGNWDICLLDIMLPGKDGLEILADIKKNEATRFKTVILLTNLGRDTIVKQGKELGAHSYLIKSEINPDEVLMAVKNALGGEVSGGDDKSES